MAYISFQPKDYFNTKLYTGTGSAQSISSVGFQPDWVWCKDRTNTYDNVLFDAVRGATKRIISNSTGAETTASTDLTSFDSDGFTVGSGSNINNSGNNFVSWNWKANGAGVSNTDGSITSTVSANDTAGFSIVKYTGTGSAGNVGHGLSTAPKVLINKSISGANDWFVGHSSIGFTKFLKLNATNAESTNSGIWNDTAPTTDHFTINSANGNTNATGVEYITYCFAEKKGFSKFGSYTGNGSATSPPFIYTGFKPAYVLIKAINATEQWGMIDNKRNTFNPVTNVALPNSSSNGSNSGTDFLSNGFAPYTGDGIMNLNSSTNYIYMAFSESSIVSSNGVAAVAR